MIKVINGALDIVMIDGEERLAIRGVIDPMSLANILTPGYQREVLTDGKIDVLKKALATSRVPDIDLGMRGTNMQEQGNGQFLLMDQTFVIDGLQRRTAAERLLQEGTTPHLGALVHLDTNENWERRRFEALNSGQTNVSTNVILRNLAEDNPGANVVYSFSNSNRFILKGKVSWKQSMGRGDLLTGIMFYKVIARLHSHLGPGRSNDAKALAMSGIPKIINRINGRVFIENVNTFFTFLNDTYNILDVSYRQHAVALKGNFMMALAGIFSDYEEFWVDDRLTINADLKRKLGTFAITDPYVKELASSGGRTTVMLENLIITHINAGKRTRHLKRRDYIAPEEIETGEELEE